jgi:anti-sigma factor RsiW
MSDRTVVSEIEKFELLSAYLDGEVSAEERQQVERWLQEDSAFRIMHQRLRSTQKSWANLPETEALAPIDNFADGVFAKIDQRRQRNWLKIGGSAIAAAVVAVGGSLAAGWDGFSNPVPQIANISLPTSVPTSLEFLPNPAPLMVALNKPIVEIAPSKAKGVKIVEEKELDPLDMVEDDI